MAVTILEEPVDVALAYNPVRFKVQAENIYEIGGDGGNPSKYILGPDNTTDAGDLYFDDTLTINLLGTSINFIFTNSTTAGEGLLPTNFSKIGGETYASALVRFLQTNHIIFRDYIVSVRSSTSVFLTARNKGSKYDPEKEAENYTFGSNLFQVNQHNAGKSASFASNRYIRGDLYVEDLYGGDFNFYSSIEQQIIDTNKIYFDFSSRMRAYFGGDSEKNQISFDGIKKLTKINKRYYIVFTEYNLGNYETTNEFKQSNMLRFIKAGIKQDEWRIFPDIVDVYLKDEEKIMSWRPKRREISPGQTDLLYFICWKSAATQVTGRIKFYYSDGTFETVSETNVSTLNNFETFMWNVGHNRITDMAAIPEGESIMGYECWWADNAAVRLCESVFFTIKPSTYFDRHFFYESSWGTFETFKTQSTNSYGVEVNKEEVLVRVTADDDYNKGDIKDIVQEFVEVFGGSTGNISQSEAAAMADFIISENKFLLRGDRLVNITVPTTSITPYEDDGFPYGFKFKYKRATTQSKYSDLIGVGSGSVGGGLIGNDGGISGALTPG